MTKIPVEGAATAAAGRKKYFKYRLKFRIHFCLNRA